MTHTTKEQLFTIFQNVVVVVLASWEFGRDAKVPEESLEVRYNLVSLLCKTQLFHIFIFSIYLKYLLWLSSSYLSGYL